MKSVRAQFDRPVFKRLYRVAYFAFAAVVIYGVVASFVLFPRINDYKKAMFSEMIYGTAYQPFVNRMLLPSATRLITAALPEAWKHDLIQTAANAPEDSFTHTMMRQAMWEKRYLPEYLVACALMYVALWGYFLALRYLCRTMMESPAWFVDLAGLLALWALPPFFRYYSYVYDFPALFFFTLGLALMAREKWILFFVVFIFSCFNKETTILLTVVFALRQGLRGCFPHRTFVTLGALQLALFVGSRVALHRLFDENPGGLVHHHLVDNLHPTRPYVISTFMAWLGVALLVARGWKDKPEFLRDASWILWLLLGATFVFGMFNELRDYYEAMPILFLLAMWEVGRILDVPLKAANQRVVIR